MISASLHYSLTRGTATFIIVAILLISPALSVTNQGTSQIQGSALPPATSISFSIFFPPHSSNSYSERFDSVQQYLSERGFRIEYSSPSKLLVTVSGPAALTERLLHIKFLTKSLPGTSSFYYYPSSSPILPPQLAGLQIFGLTNNTIFSPQYIALGMVNSSGLFQSSLPRSTPISSSLHFAATYYSPSVFQQAYNETPLFESGVSGQGQTIAIIDAYGDPTIYQDVEKFDSLFGLPPLQLQVIPIGAYQPELGIGTGWDVETALDVEAAHMMAPQAKIVLLVANGHDVNNGLFDAIDMVVTKHLANVTSMSWGAPENLFAASGFFASGFDNYPFSEYYFALGSSQGISFFASSGDLGANGGTQTKYGAVTYPSSSPFVTSVGGTTLFVRAVSGSLQSTSRIQYAGEVAWSSSPQYLGYTVSTGGGMSSFFSRPWYQNGIVSSSQRGVPDVAADANPYTGAIIEVEGQTYAIGGTSLSSPIWAGMASLLDQYANSKIGLMNPHLYSAYQRHPEAFNDVSFGYNNGYFASSGYDMLTGLGTPNLGVLAKYIVPYQLTVKVSTNSISSQNYPQYPYGSPIQIVARALFPDGLIVTSGSLNASLYSSKGLVVILPMSFNGTSWIASFTPDQNSPPSTWQIIVAAESQGYLGYGYYSFSVGLGINIISPIPYPYAPPLQPGQTFAVEAEITYPNGSYVNSGSFSAYLFSDGTLQAKINLINESNGTFVGFSQLASQSPQGTYIMIVNGSSSGQLGSAYTYEYFGEGILDAAVITPTDEAIPSASPGQTITLIAATLTSNNTGLFDSNLTANIIDLKGKQIASLTLTPAPSTPQYGLLNLFGFHIANYTIPSFLPQGFYTIQFISSYKQGDTSLQGYYNTSFYVAPGSLNISFSTPAYLLEGEKLSISAKAFYPNGSEVTSGLFMLTVNPSALNYASNLVAVQTGVPMQYNASSSMWQASYTIPNQLSTGFYQGVPQYTLAGSWTAVISGESMFAVPNIPQFNFFNVLPYNELDVQEINQSNAASVRFVNFFSGRLSMINDGGGNLTVKNLNVDISSGLFKQLNLVNCTGIISGVTLNRLVLVNSNVTIYNVLVENSDVGIRSVNSTALIANAEFRNLTYAFEPDSSSINTLYTSYSNVSNISSLGRPKILLSSTSVSFPSNGLTLKITGKQLRLNSITLNGISLNVSSETQKGELILHIPFDGLSMPDGAYILNVSVTSGLIYTQAIPFINNYHESLLLLITAAIAIVALIVLIFFVVRRMLQKSVHRQSISSGQSPIS